MSTASDTSRPTPSSPSRSNDDPSALAWLRRYDRRWLRSDAVAGVTLAAYLLPSGLADASLAQLPPEAGIYTCMFAGLVFWLFCSSTRTSVTPTSAISLLLGSSLGALTNGDPSRFSALAACTALLVAALAFAAWLLRAGSLVNFVSETVLIGFKTGVAFTLASTQLPKLLGISGAHGGFVECMSHVFSHVGETNFASLAVGLGALGLLILGKVFLKNRPVALFVMIAAILATSLLGLGDRGVKLLGELPQGLPRFQLPAVAWSDLNELLPIAMACFLLGSVETAAIGRMFASKHGERLDANKEFLALAGANLAVGLGQGFPVSGGMSQSLVNESAGAKTPASGLFAALMILVVALFFSNVFRDLPQPVLAAIILMAVSSLVNVAVLRHLWKNDRQEFLIAVVAFVGVLASGLLRGVLIGAAISMVLLIRRASRPHVAFLGRIPGSQRYSDRERHSDNEDAPGIVIFRPESSLLYFNAEHVRDTVVAHVRASEVPVRAVVCDLAASPVVDLAGAEMLKALWKDLWTMGAPLQIVEARANVRDRLRTEGIEEFVGRIDRFTTVADAMTVLLAETAGGAANAPAGEGPLLPNSGGTGDDATKAT